MNAIRRRFRITGRVQGVGFRWFTRQAAQRLGLGGWVANRSDGSVECEAQGEPAAVEELRRELATGPRWASVADVEQEEVPTGPAREFEIR